MKELEEFFKDIKRIADAMEFQNKVHKKALELAGEDANCEVTNAADENVPSEQVQNVQPVQMAAEPVIQPATNAIPVSTVVQTYTQDQLAIAMSRAVEMGKMAEIQNILLGFGVDNLMALNPNNYNDLALKLREIGVEV